MYSTIHLHDLRKILYDDFYKTDYFDFLNEGRCFCFSFNFASKKAYVVSSGYYKKYKPDEKAGFDSLQAVFCDYFLQKGYHTSPITDPSNIPYIDEYGDLINKANLSDSKINEIWKREKNAWSCCERKILGEICHGESPSLENFQDAAKLLYFYCKKDPCELCKPFLKDHENFFSLGAASRSIEGLEYKRVKIK